MIYLDGEELLRLHKLVIDFAGGSHGVRDTGLLASILEAPKQSFAGGELYSDVYTKAAVYLERIARFHVFVDGNKRTALACTVRFLRLNQVKMNASNKDFEQFILALINERYAIPRIAEWIKKHSKAIR